MFKKYLVVPFLLSAMGAATGCMSEADAETNTGKPEATVIASGEYTVSGLSALRKIEIYGDQSSFNTSLYEFVQPIDEESVDFSLNKVVLFSMGERPSGGYSVSVSGIEESDDHVKVSVLYSFPGNDCMVTSVVTSPFQFIKINTTKELVFEESIQAAPCS